MAEEKQKKHFFGDIKKELKKVTWPTRKQTVKNTCAVIVLVLLVSLIVIIFDFGLRKGNDAVINVVTNGKVAEYRDRIDKKNAILEEMAQYTDKETLASYSQLAYYMSVEQLQEALEQMKEEANNPSSENEGEEENNVEGEENSTVEEQTQQ